MQKVDQPITVFRYSPTGPAALLVLYRSHYITPEQFGQNVDKVIQKGKDSGVKHFLLISPPPVCEVCKQGKPVSILQGQEGGVYE